MSNIPSKHNEKGCPDGQPSILQKIRFELQCVNVECE